MEKVSSNNVVKNADYFEEVKGYAEIKQELHYILDIIQNPEKYKKLGAEIPSGLLLFGNPGVGKTLICNCFNEASGKNVFVCRKKKSDGDFLEEIEATFREAHEAGNSIVFLDDMDKFENEDFMHRNADAYVAVQSMMDEYKDVFVVATANDLSNLPSSLLRAGRFDRKIEVRNPIGKDAEEVVQYYLSKKNCVADLDGAFIARILDGSSCAELETVINEAGVYAGYHNKEKIDMDDMLYACMRVIFKAPESLEEVDEEELRFIAYHEAGHAVVSDILEPGSVNIVSVKNYAGDVGGITSYYQEKNYFRHKSYMENRVRSLLGGKAATEIAFQEVDVCSKSDLNRAFAIVSRFVNGYCALGFTLGNIDRASSDDTKYMSEMKTACEMERYYLETKRILLQNKQYLDGVVAALVEKKTITVKDMERIRKECGVEEKGKVLL